MLLGLSAAWQRARACTGCQRVFGCFRHKSHIRDTHRLISCTQSAACSISTAARTPGLMGKLCRCSIRAPNPSPLQLCSLHALIGSRSWAVLAVLRLLERHCLWGRCPGSPEAVKNSLRGRRARSAPPSQPCRPCWALQGRGHPSTLICGPQMQQRPPPPLWQQGRRRLSHSSSGSSRSSSSAIDPLPLLSAPACQQRGLTLTLGQAGGAAFAAGGRGRGPSLPPLRESLTGMQSPELTLTSLVVLNCLIAVLCAEYKTRGPLDFTLETLPSDVCTVVKAGCRLELPLTGAVLWGSL